MEQQLPQGSAFSSLLSSCREWKSSWVSCALEIDTGSHSQLDNSHHGNISLISHFKDTVVGKLIPSFEGNKLGLHGLESFLSLNTQTTMAEFKP